MNRSRISETAGATRLGSNAIFWPGSPARYDARHVKRIHFFEVFAVANLAIVALLFHATASLAGSPLRHLLSFSVGIGMQALAGIIVRSIVSGIRGDRTYFNVIRDPAWIVETLRLIVFGAVIVVAYGWIKLTVPLYHPRLFDEALWAVDRALFFGIEPSTFLLNLFNTGPFLRVVDLSYAYIFFASATVAYAFFLSAPDRKLRVAFANGNAVLWMLGAWLYLLVPSLGPALRFPDIWFAHTQSLQVTQTMQALLMRNYQNVIRAANGAPVTEPIRIVFGLAAFPSLHVAFQTYVFLWMRRVWTAGEVLFGIFAVTIFLGSMITGWHYLVDGLAGLLMAYLCYRLCFPREHATDGTTDQPGRTAGEADGRGGAV
jgi:hypothetical protein